MESFGHVMTSFFFNFNNDSVAVFTTQLRNRLRVVDVSLMIFSLWADKDIIWLISPRYLTIKKEQFLLKRVKEIAQ